MEDQLGIVLEDDATEPGEHSYQSLTFGLSIRLKITTAWSPGILCRFFAMTHSNLGIYDFGAPNIPFERHLAGLVEVYDFGRLIPDEEVKRRWENEGRS